MLDTTVGSVVINSMLPEDLRDYNRVLDKKETAKLLTQVARRYPDQYKDLSHAMVQFSNEASYVIGGQSFRLEDLKEASGVKKVRDTIESETQAICRKYYRLGIPLDSPKVQKEILEATSKHYGELSDAVIKEKSNTPFYRQVAVVGSGKLTPFKSVVGADLQYEDQDKNPVPIPVTHSYSYGLTPAEYFAGAFGARKGVVDLQKATADAGFLAKQLVQIAHREVVSADDAPEPYDETCPVGYPASSSDSDNEGAYLAHPVAGYPRNTLLTSKVLRDIKNKGIDKILVRSLTVGGPSDGGVYSYDAGIRERGDRPALGDFVGIAAVQSMSEPLTQGSISCLHPLTMVRMANGTTKHLKDICVGDEVLGSSYSGELAPTKVVRVFDQGKQPVYVTKYKTATILATLEHKVLQYHMGAPKVLPIEAKGPVLLTRDGFLRVNSMREQWYLGRMDTLDIEVSNESHLFVLANGLIVSNSKHSGGVVGASSAKTISGFEHINQLIQVPQHFKYGATHSQADGIVTNIVEAPQGGKYVYVDGQKHYVPPQQGKDVPLLVKKGDTIEAGDRLSEGIPNPAEVVKFKGIGEGRRAFVQQFGDTFKAAGQGSNRRNIEALSRGLITYVRLTSEMGDYSQDEILPYSMVASQYKPRAGFKEDDPSNLEGYYLEKPVLHYTIGTKLRPSVIKMLKDYGVDHVLAHEETPLFEPEMIRGMAHASKDPDWGTKLLGAYNKDSLLESARKGATSYTEGTSYVPALAFGDSSSFGSKGAISGYNFNF